MWLILNSLDWQVLRRDSTKPSELSEFKPGKRHEKTKVLLTVRAGQSVWGHPLPFCGRDEHGRDGAGRVRGSGRKACMPQCSLEEKTCWQAGPWVTSTCRGAVCWVTKPSPPLLFCSHDPNPAFCFSFFRHRKGAIIIRLLLLNKWQNCMIWVWKDVFRVTGYVGWSEARFCLYMQRGREAKCK